MASGVRECAALHFAWDFVRRPRYEVRTAGDDNAPNDIRATALHGLRSFGNIL